MFLRIKDRIFNTDHIVEVDVAPAQERHMDEYGESFPARPLSVAITTTATVSTYNDGGDYPGSAHNIIHALEIVLYDEEAELFLAALAVYEPALETEGER